MPPGDKQHGGIRQFVQFLSSNHCPSRLVEGETSLNPVPRRKRVWILAFRSQRRQQQKRQSLINPCLSRPGELTPPPPSSDLRRCLPVEEMEKKAKLTLKIPLPLFPPLRMQKVVVGAAFLRAHAKISPLGHHNRQANICQPLMDPHNGLEKGGFFDFEI